MKKWELFKEEVEEEELRSKKQEVKKTCVPFRLPLEI
jgi:hypothetical protein